MRSRTWMAVVASLALVVIAVQIQYARSQEQSKGARANQCGCRRPRRGE